MKKSIDFDERLAPGMLAVSCDGRTMYMSLALDSSEANGEKVDRIKKMIVVEEGTVVTIISVLRNRAYRCGDDLSATRCNIRNDAIVWDPSNMKLGRISTMNLMRV